jgi:hypothetical protein
VAVPSFILSNADIADEIDSIGSAQQRRANNLAEVARWVIPQRQPSEIRRDLAIVR